jgi:anthranilate 1,2-dioxygenase ferredoxin subunit
LAEGWVEGDEVECPFHQGRFHIPGGQPTAPPCTVPLRIWKVKLIEGDIWIDTNLREDRGHAAKRTK